MTKKMMTPMRATNSTEPTAIKAICQTCNPVFRLGNLTSLKQAVSIAIIETLKSPPGLTSNTFVSRLALPKMPLLQIPPKPKKQMKLDCFWTVQSALSGSLQSVRLWLHCGIRGFDINIRQKVIHSVLAAGQPVAKVRGQVKVPVFPNTITHWSIMSLENPLRKTQGMVLPTPSNSSCLLEVQTIGAVMLIQVNSQLLNSTSTRYWRNNWKLSPTADTMLDVMVSLSSLVLCPARAIVVARLISWFQLIPLKSTTKQLLSIFGTITPAWNGFVFTEIAPEAAIYCVKAGVARSRKMSGSKMSFIKYRFYEGRKFITQILKLIGFN